MFKKYSIEIQWAVIFTLMMLVWMVLERWFGLHDTHIKLQSTVSNFVFIPAITIYVLALLDKKQSYYSGNMNYKQAFLSGLAITIVVTILSPLMQYISLTLISPYYFNNAINYYAFSGKMTFDEAVSYFNLQNFIITGLMFTLFIGILTSLIVAYFVKTKEKK